MSARTAALRTASAAVVAAAIAGTVLMPMTASADEGNPQALKTTMSAPVPSGPLTRGGATETFDLTVTNTTDKVSSYHPWMLLDPTGGSPLQQSDVVYKVEAVSAPATEYNIGQQDGEWQGLFHPAGDKASDGFQIPAGGKMVWKITIGLGKSYPTLNGDFTLRASSFANEIANGGEGSLAFKTGPASKPGALETWFDMLSPCADTETPDCQEMDVRYRVTGDGEFNTALSTFFNVDMDSKDDADIQTRVKVGGEWKDLTGGNGSGTLPVIPKGYGAASGDVITHVQVKLGPKSKLKKLTDVKVSTMVGLAEGNTYQFEGAEQPFQLGPKTTTPPTSPAPTSPAPTSPAPTTPAPTGSATTAPATTAPAAATTPATGNTPKPTGSLAHTGSDSNTALYSGLAAVLIGLGGAAAWFARRRRTVRG
ncbi:LAETG motif-containing sortase-dependent surface protein [Streptomyces sp. NPDC058289]|uniref:LAETG motif-containing sortase-dependent surface protein n=1 Tax=Streptomyces sp. NPDC058289 TaxID=3346425 RepID=UPI0036E3CE92